MGTIILIVVFLIALDLAALRWGADSRDGLNSPEWARRGSWFLPVRHASSPMYGYVTLYRSHHL